MQWSYSFQEEIKTLPGGMVSAGRPELLEYIQQLPHGDRHGKYRPGRSGTIGKGFQLLSAFIYQQEGRQMARRRFLAQAVKSRNRFRAELLSAEDYKIHLARILV